MVLEWVENTMAFGEYMIDNQTLLHPGVPIGLGWLDDSMKLTGVCVCVCALHDAPSHELHAGPTEEDKHFINDTGSTPQMTRDIAAEIVAAKSIIVPQLQHLGLMEQPAAFSQPVVEFLDGVLK